MHDPAACGARPAQQASAQVLPANTDVIGVAVEMNAAISNRVSKTLLVRLLSIRLDCDGFILRALILSPGSCCASFRAYPWAAVRCRGNNEFARRFSSYQASVRHRSGVRHDNRSSARCGLAGIQRTDLLLLCACLSGKVQSRSRKRSEEHTSELQSHSF